MGHTAQVHSDASQLLLIDHHKLDQHADHENDDGEQCGDEGHDDLGSTDKCLKTAQNRLQEGKSVYIDATNGGMFYCNNSPTKL